jgi:hypothetical protein
MLLKRHFEGSLSFSASTNAMKSWNFLNKSVDEYVRPALRKANLPWYGWHAFRRWARCEPAQIGSFRQGDSTNSSSRKRHHDDEYLREDGERGRGDCDEEPGNNVCNYCATSEAPFGKMNASRWTPAAV